MSNLQLTRELPENLSYKFLKKERFAIGPWRSDGFYLYLDNRPICFIDTDNTVYDVHKATALPPYKEPFYKSAFFQTLAITLPIIFLFFYFLSMQF